MLNYEFNSFSTMKPGLDIDLYHKEHRNEIDEADLLVQSLSSAIYGCGSETTQSQYASITSISTVYDMIASKLSSPSTTQSYLVEGCNISTTADIAYFTTLFWFSDIYHILNKTNSHLLTQTPSLLRFMKRGFIMEGVSKTCNINEMKVH